MMGGGGGGSDGTLILRPQKYISLKFYTQKNLASKFSAQTILRLHTSILIYSIKQTVKPKKYVTDLLTQKIPKV